MVRGPDTSSLPAPVGSSMDVLRSKAPIPGNGGHSMTAPLELNRHCLHGSPNLGIQFGHNKERITWWQRVRYALPLISKRQRTRWDDSDIVESHRSTTLYP
jgi:hypothetical protein